MLESLLTALGIIAFASIVAGATVHFACEVIARLWRRYIPWR